MNILKNWALHGFIVGLIIESFIKKHYYDFYNRYEYICYAMPAILGLVGVFVMKKQRQV